MVGYITNFLLLFLIRLTYRAINGDTSGYFFDIKNMIVVGTGKDAEDVWNLFQHTGLDRKYIGFLSGAREDSQSDKFLGIPETMEEMVSIFDVKEIIFSQQCCKYPDHHRRHGAGWVAGWNIRLPPGIRLSEAILKILPGICIRLISDTI